MLARPLAAIDWAFLREQIAAGLQEGLQIEFKSEPPQRSVQFLKVVCAFANADGGDLIYGVTDARELVGVEDANLLRDRLQDMLNNGLEPRHLGVGFAVVPISANRTALLVRIPKSLVGPHVVSVDGHWRFYVRTGAITAEMGVNELRSAFALTSGIEQEIAKLRLSRLSGLKEDKAALQLAPWTGPIGAVHIFTNSSAIGRSVVDVSRLNEQFQFAPIGGTYRTSQFQFDGLVRIGNQNGHRIGERFSCYSLLGRTGWVESVFGGLVDDDGPWWHASWTHSVVTLLHQSLVALRNVDAQPPWHIGVAVINSHGMRLMYPGHYFGAGNLTSVRPSDLILPMQTLNELPDIAEFRRQIKPTFDVLWNSFGEAAIPDEFLAPRD